MRIKEKFAVTDVRIPLKRKKTLDSAKVEDIAYDMLENDQTTPIRLRTDKVGGYSLVEGYHRLEALRAIGEMRLSKSRLWAENPIVFLDALSVKIRMG